MGMFSAILDKLGFGKKPAAASAKKESAKPATPQAGPLASATPKPAVAVSAKQEPAAKPQATAKPAASAEAPKPKAHLTGTPKPAAPAPKATLANTIGQHKQPEAAEPVEPAAAAPAPAPAPAPEPEPEPEVEAISVVDVVADLEARAAKHPEKLNWKVSIVDLLKLLGLDSSFAARKELAVELECPADLMSDSAKMNTWLHKTVLAKIAENGGNIPQDLLD